MDDTRDIILLLAVLVTGNHHRIVPVLVVDESHDHAAITQHIGCATPLLFVRRNRSRNRNNRSGSSGAAVVFGEEVDVTRDALGRHTVNGLHLGVLVKQGFVELA